MQITSLFFAGFVVIALVIYYLLPHRGQNYWLLLVSYIFYISWSWQFALVLVFLTLINFILAYKIKGEEKVSKGLLWTGILLNILILAFFKYSGFFVNSFILLFTRLGVASQAGGIHILLPVGLSFYVLGSISYLVDVSRGQVQPVSDLADYALYMAYFPKLLSGPIERVRTFMPKLLQPRLVDNKVFTNSLILILIGIVRKVVIADTLAAMIPSEAFQTPQAFNTLNVWAWLIAYAFALYNDFAGYIDIIRGVSGLFGIELSVNFRTPYFSRNFTEFWNRWHITLSHWLRDYIYYPITRALMKRSKKQYNIMTIVIPPVVTMLASGLWHQASWSLLLWGGLHGIYQVVERIPSISRPIISPDKQPRWRQILSGLVVFFLAILAWVPFRMDLSVSLAFWERLFVLTNFRFREWRIIIVSLLAIGLDTILYFSRDEFVFLHWPRPVRAALLALAVIIIFLVTRTDTGLRFIYQGF